MSFDIIYLAAAGLSCSMGDLSCIICGISVVVVVVHRLQLQLTGPLAVARRLSYLAACGILVPPTRIEPMFPALQGGLLTTGPPGRF